MSKQTPSERKIMHPQNVAETWPFHRLDLDWTQKQILEDSFVASLAFALSIQSVRHLSFRINTFQQQQTTHQSAHKKIRRFAGKLRLCRQITFFGAVVKIV